MNPDALPWFADASWLPWLDLVGRLHPLLVHVPLGVLPVLALLEAWGQLRRKPLDHGVRRALISLAALVAAAAALGGWLLAEEPAYGGADLELHRKLGLGLAGVSLFAMLAAWTRTFAVYGWALAIAVGLLLPAGHLGGSMVHGDDFVTGPFWAALDGERYEPPARGGGLPVDTPGVAGVPVGEPAADDALVVDPEGVYARRVAPLLESHCAACHGADKQRGGLALHTAAALLAGGDAGASIVPGDAAASELVRRLRLPPQDEAHMPPEGKHQPGAGDVELVAAWIDAGAPLVGGAPLGGVEVAGGGLTGEVGLPAGVAAGGESGSPAPADDAADVLGPAADPETVQALRERLVHVEVIDPAGGALRVGYAARPECEDAELAELVALGGRLVELDLAGTAVSDEGMLFVGCLLRLEELDLRGTAVTAAGIAELGPLRALRRLNLTGTAAGDDAVDALAALPALERVHVWDTALTAEGVARLAELRPELHVEHGALAQAEALETEPDVVFTKVGEAAPPAGAADLTPVNSVCPVSGGPVDPAFAVVHDGRVIGFCCNQCPTTFWADPASYPLE